MCATSFVQDVPPVVLGPTGGSDPVLGATGSAAVTINTAPTPVTFQVACTSQVALEFSGTLYAPGTTGDALTVYVTLQLTQVGAPSSSRTLAHPPFATMTLVSTDPDVFVPSAVPITVALNANVGPGTYTAYVLVYSDNTTNAGLSGTITVSGTLNVLTVKS